MTIEPDHSARGGPDRPPAQPDGQETPEPPYPSRNEPAGAGGSGAGGTYALRDFGVGARRSLFRGDQYSSRSGVAARERAAASLTDS